MFFNRFGGYEANMTWILMHNYVLPPSDAYFLHIFRVHPWRSMSCIGKLMEVLGPPKVFRSAFTNFTSVRLCGKSLL